MLPHIHILGIHVPMYSLMVFLGFISYLIVFKIMFTKIEKVSRVSYNRLLLTSIVGFVVLGASALVFNSLFHSIEQGKLIIGGITWLGGVIGLLPAMIFLIHMWVPEQKGSAIETLSCMLPGLTLAHAFGRIGCFCGGCCYGQVTDSPLGVSFPAGSNAAKLYPLYPGVEDSVSQPVLPTQLFEAIFEVLLFVAMMLLARKARKYFLEIYCFAYGAFRFVLEFWRGDSRGSTGFALSPSQLMCILLWIGAVMLILFRNRIIFKKLYAKAEVWKLEAAHRASTYKRPFPIGNTATTLNTIRELHKMVEEGIITQEEFEAKKADLMSRL